MRSLLPILILILSCDIAAGQKVAWESTSYNFGTVRDWDSPPAIFRIRNTGKSKLMFLPQHFGRDVQVILPNRSIAPGETAEVVIHYYTPATGPFFKTVEIYSNASDRAQKLTVKGNIASLRNNALTACPTFHSDMPAQSTGASTITVVDRSTGEQVAGARVELFKKKDSRGVYVTDSRGLIRSKLEMGKFTAQVEHIAYYPTVQEISLERRQGTVIIFVEPISPTRERQPARQEVATDLGITVNERWQDEPPMDYGIAINDQIEASTPDDRWADEEPTATGAAMKEPLDLGININEQIAQTVEPDRWAEPEPPATPTESTEEFDLGISINDQFDEPVRQEPVISTSPIAAAPEPRPTPAPSMAEEIPESEEVEEEESEFAETRYRPNNIVLLLDVSSSMRKEGKLDMLKISASRLIGMMRPIDKLSVLAFSSSVFTVQPTTPVTAPELIVERIFELEAEGYTSGVKGMKEAYDQLAAEWVEDGNNQLILVTDGMFTSSSFTEKDAVRMASEHAGKGIILSVAGYRNSDAGAERMMKRIARRGKGSYLQLDSEDGAVEVLATEIRARSLRPIVAQ